MTAFKQTYQDAYTHLAHRLKAAREAAGLTQQQAASALNRSQSYLTKCETGEKRIDVIEVLVFADLYQRDIAFFTTGLLPMPHAAHHHAAAADDAYAHRTHAISTPQIDPRPPPPWRRRSRKD